jgi:hypothetical protein
MFEFELHERENGLWAYTVTDLWGDVWEEAEGIATEAKAYDQAEQLKLALERMHL